MRGLALDRLGTDTPVVRAPRGRGYARMGTEQMFLTPQRFSEAKSASGFLYSLNIMDRLLENSI